MKILYITSMYYPDEPGGAEVQTRRIVTHMVSEKIEVVVLSFDSAGKSTIEEFNGYKIIRLYVPRLSETLLNKTAKRISIGKFKLFLISQSPFIWKELQKEFLKYKYLLDNTNIVHFSNSLNSISHSKLLKFISHNFKDAKLVLTFHDFFFLGRRSVYPNKRIPLISCYKQKLLKKYIDWFLTPSEFVRRIAIDDLAISEDRIVKIYNTTHNKTTIGKSGNSYPLNIIYAGSTEYAKGTDILIEGFLELCKLYKGKIRLIIAGGGDYISEVEQSLRQIEPDSYELHSWLPFTELNEILKKSDIFVLPSRYNETFGIGLIDAYLAGCLPMGSDRGAIPEILNNDNDLIFTPGEDFVNKIQKFIKEPELISRKYKSLEPHMQKFDSEEIQQEYYNFYKKVIN